MKCKLILYATSVMGVFGLLEARLGNSGYSLELLENQNYGSFINRKLDMKIDSEPAGYVRYSISTSPHGISSINVLFVEKKFRGNRGCGKMLLHSAINDILFNGSTVIELNRCPFDLPSDERWEMRNEDLKKWYSKFGFIESAGRGSFMHITNPSKFYATQVMTAFTEEGPIFLFR